MTPDLMTQLRAKLARTWTEDVRSCGNLPAEDAGIFSDGASAERARTAPIVAALLECAAACQYYAADGQDDQVARDALTKLERLTK